MHIDAEALSNTGKRPWGRHIDAGEPNSKNVPMVCNHVAAAKLKAVKQGEDPGAGTLMLASLIVENKE